MDSTHVKASVASYFRYKRQCPLICFERTSKTYDFYSPDILVVRKDRKIIEVEVKVSISDLKNDCKKRIWVFRKAVPDIHPMPYQFYYAVPYKLREKALKVIGEWKDEVYGKVGLLYVIDKKRIGMDDVTCFQKAPTNKTSPRLSIKEILTMTRNQSGTICSLSVALAKLQKKNVDDGLDIEYLI